MFSFCSIRGAVENNLKFLGRQKSICRGAHHTSPVSGGSVRHRGLCNSDAQQALSAQPFLNI
jgi:hypothetical protein